MPIGLMDFKPAPARGNPLAQGIAQGQAIYSTGLEQQKIALANALAQARLPYMSDEEKAKLERLQALPDQTRAQTKLYGSQSEQALAQAAYDRSEQQKNLWQVNHPLAMLGDTGQTILASQLLKGMPGAQQGSQGANPQTTSSDNLGTGNGVSDLSSMLQQKLDPIGYANRLKNIDINNNLISDASSAGSAAMDMQYAQEKMDSARGNLTGLETGPVLGHLPGVTDAAQEFDQASTARNAAMSRAQQSGHITNFDYQYYNKIGTGRTLKDEPYKIASEFNSAIQKRIQEKAPFYAAAASAGLPPSVYQPLYNKYLNERPVFDYSKNKPIPENLNSWSDYLDKNAIKSIYSGKDFSPRRESSGKSSRKEGNVTKYTRVNGKLILQE